MIILKHREHGTHFANEEMEAQECERNGWVRVDKAETNPFVETLQPMDEAISQTDAQAVEKFDRTLHMKKMWAEGRMKKK